MRQSIDFGSKMNLQKNGNQIKANEHFVDMLLLLLSVLILINQYLGIVGCLIRADYTFLIAAFCYFIKQSKWDIQIVKLEIALFLASLIFDIVYCLIQIRVWFQVDIYQEIWQTTKPIHSFVSGIFALEFIVKIALFIFLFKAKGLMDK